MPPLLSQRLKKVYRTEIKSGLGQLSSIVPDNVTENDIVHLPKPVQNYLRYVGVIGKPKVLSANLELEGRIRKDETNNWIKFKSKQYNFYNEPTRVFLMKARKSDIPSNGLHVYKNQNSSRIVKIDGLIKVVDDRIPELNRAETVTIFNDMCVFAPATLINKIIEWKLIDPLIVKARYTNGNIAITATLFFNEKGEMENFTSYDRYECIDGTTYFNCPWSTNISDYKNYRGVKLGSKTTFIYHRPGKDFIYGRYNLKSVEYNFRRPITK